MYLPDPALHVIVVAHNANGYGTPTGQLLSFTMA